MNTKTIKFDLNKYKLYEKIKAKQGDTKSRFLLFQLLDGSIPFNLKNRSVRAYMVKPDGREIFNDLIVNNYNLGYCTLELTNQVLAVPGTVKIELMVTEEEKKLTSSVFELEVVKSINSEKSIVSTNEFTALLNGLAALSEYDNYKNAVKEMEINKADKAKVEEKFGEVYEQLDKTNNNVELNYAKKTDVARISSGTPLFAPSTTEMTDTTKNYVNTTDGYLYIYLGGTWVNSNVKYQEKGLSDGQVVPIKTNFVEFVNILDNYEPILNMFLASNVGTSTINDTNVSIENNIVAIIDIINGEQLTIKKGSKRILLYMYDEAGILRYYDIHETESYSFKCEISGYNITKIAIVSESLDHQLFKGNEVVDNVEKNETTQVIKEVKDIDIKVKNIENNFLNENKINEFIVNSLENYEVIKGATTTISVVKINGESGKYYYSADIINSSNQDVNMFYFCYNTSNSVVSSGNIQSTNNGYRLLEVDLSDEVTTVELKIRNYGTSSIFIKDVYFGTSKYSNKLKELQSYIDEVIKKSTSLNKLYSKNITCFGDSITYGAENNDISYVNKIANRNNMQIYKRAVSGATFVKHNGRSCIMEQVQNFINEGKSNLDYIILSGGYNDSQRSVSSQIGTINEMDYSGNYDTTTFLGAVETCIYKLIKAYPEAKILGVIVYKVSSEYELYRKELLKAYAKWGILVSNLAEETPLVANSNHPTAQKYFHHPDTGITVHPNDLGQEVISISVENKLKLF